MTDETEGLGQSPEGQGEAQEAPVRRTPQPRAVEPAPAKPKAPESLMARAVREHKERLEEADKIRGF